MSRTEIRTELYQVCNSSFAQAFKPLVRSPELVRCNIDASLTHLQKDKLYLKTEDLDEIVVILTIVRGTR
jgi:hypothetical protein